MVKGGQGAGGRADDGKSGEVKEASEFRATGGDEAFAIGLAAVASEGSQAQESGDLAAMLCSSRSREVSIWRSCF